MIKLTNILKESLDNFETVNQEISNLMRSNPPSTFESLLDKVYVICDKYGVDYYQYLKWLKTHNEKR